MRVNNPDCSALSIHSCDTTPTPSGFAEIVTDDLPNSLQAGKGDLDGTEHVKESSTIFVVLVKVPSVTLNDVSPHLHPGLKELVGLDLRWDRRFTRSPDPTGAELTEANTLLEDASPEGCLSVSRGLDCSQQSDLNKE